MRHTLLLKAAAKLMGQTFDIGKPAVDMNAITGSAMVLCCLVSIIFLKKFMKKVTRGLCCGKYAYNLNWRYLFPGVRSH